MTSPRHHTPVTPAAAPIPTARAARTVADLARGTGALGALLVALVGVPWALLTFGGAPLPSRLPSLTEVSEALTRPDDGSLFLDALVLVGWVGWVAFAVSVAVEVPAQLRGRSAPRLPTLGASQRLAGALVAALVVLVVSTPAPPAATGLRVHHTTSGGSDHLAVAHGDIDMPVPAAGDRHPVVAAARAVPTRHPTYSVQRQDTLWGIAERCLGAGERFPEIATLNYGVTQPDGRSLTSSHWIYPGWLLRLPPDARIDTSMSGSRGPSKSTEDTATYTVRPGDTLWDIAESELGAAHRYGDIAALNTGDRQPDGDRLRDPDHIEPGWLLALPGTSARDPARDATPTRRHPEPDAAHDHSTPPTPPSHNGRQAESGPPARDGIPAERADPDMAGHADDHLDEASDAVPAKVGLGLAGITAAALLAVIARRRVLQQRARLPGRRIALPDPLTRALETRLRAADERDTLRQLRSALLQLATGCSQAGRDLPAVAGVCITRTDIELLLLHEDVDAIEPFTGVSATRWRANLDDPQIGDAVPTMDGVTFPYPALLTVDATEDSTLLIDLEAAGTLSVIGSEEAVTPVLNAWAVELALAPVWDTLGVTLVGGGWPSAAVDAARVRLLETADTAARRAAIRTRDVASILGAAQVGSLRDARSRGVAHDAWDPEIVLWHTGDDRSPREELLRAAGPGLAVVTRVTNTAPGESGWTLAATDAQMFRLEPLGIDVTPPRLEDPHLLAVTAVLEVAHDATGVEPTDAPVAAEATHGSQVSTSDLSPAGVTNDDRFDDDPRCGPPMVLVLGPVEIRFASGEDADPARRRKLTELAAFIALHPGADNHGIDDAVWPVRRVSTSTRNSATSRLRRWLGTNPDGEPWLPLVPDRGQYRFRPDVRCDWQVFQELARRGLAGGAAGLDELGEALALVRGRPFAGVDPAAYTWAEYDTQEMISAITDVAHMLSSARLVERDPARARDAAARGLLVEPCSELLTQDAIRAATALGDSEEAERLLERLRTRLSIIDPDADVGWGTAELVHGLVSDQ